MGDQKKRGRRFHRGDTQDSKTRPETNRPDPVAESFNAAEAAASAAAPEASQTNQAEAAQPAELSAEEIELLHNELETQRLKASEYFEGWQRERADFSNYKKRIERDQLQLSSSITGSVVKKYLVILDDLERALKARPREGEGAAWAEGIELVSRKLQGILEAEGIQRIQAENEFFDPSRHEAILQEESPDHESGTVIEVLQPGYTLGDRVLRPAQVKVAR
jgi:molecular chaperone GrpE